MKKFFRKGNRGITLIALVITIIVLLILAGITIGTISGDNGIINNAVQAKRDTEISEWKEKIDVAIVKAEGRKSNATIDDVINELIKDKIISDPSQVNKGTGEITTNKPSYVIEGKLDEYTGLTATDLVNTSDKNEIYGAEVKNYATADDSKAHADGWKIFYAGTMGEETTPHIYLIASDYIEYEYIPYSTNNGSVTTNKPNQRSNTYPRAAYFTNILGDYAGSASITDSKIQALNYSYFSQGFTSTNINMKAVAYMLDTEAWKDFAGSKAEYAIGGPTVEMLMNSYSQKYGVDYRAQASSSTGYQISADGGASWENYSSMLSTADSLYVIQPIRNAYAMWLATPSAGDTNSLLSVYAFGTVHYNNYEKLFLGFRPLVCLESNVELQKNTSESGEVYYMIKE